MKKRGTSILVFFETERLLYVKVSLVWFSLSFPSLTYILQKTNGLKSGSGLKKIKTQLKKLSYNCRSGSEKFNFFLKFLISNIQPTQFCLSIFVRV